MKSDILKDFDWKSLSQPVIGVDEVGRGCLAGAVYAAAVVLNLDEPTDHFKDSKTLTTDRRRNLCDELLRKHLVGVGCASVKEIEQLNILQASLLAMKRAVLKLGLLKGTVLVDGVHPIPSLGGLFHQITLIKGDQRAQPVAAASIVAKVTRDEEMVQLSKEFPEYGFEVHKGYGTPMHRARIEQHGPCSEHRALFKGVKEFWPNARSLG